MNIKYARIGKQVLVQTLGVQENFKEYNSNGNVIYYNEKNYYHIPIDIRLSKSQLKLFIYLHFLNPDKNGIIKNITEKELANRLNINIKTLRINFNRLINLNYLWICNGFEGQINILLANYKDYHLTKKEGGYGYLTLSQSTLEYLLSIDNVNVLRLELRRLLIIDTNQNNKATCTYKDIQRYLPKYYNHNSIVIKLLKRTSTNLFTTNLHQDYIDFNLNDEYNIKIIKNQEKQSLRNYFLEFFESKGYYTFRMFPETLNDFIQMALQYNDKELITNAFNEIVNKYFDNEIPVKNIGGLIRTIVESKIRNLKKII